MAIAVSNSVVIPPVNGGNGTLTDEYINGLVQGGSWQFGAAPRILTYSLNINFDTDALGNTIPGPGGAWTTPLIDAVNRALTAWSNVANISFQNITSGIYFNESHADIALTLTGNDLQTSGGAVGLGFFPDPAFTDGLINAVGLTAADYPNPTGDVFYDNYYFGYNYLYAGGFGYEAILHELGHALGLKHPDDDGGNGRPTFAQLGIAASDSERFTIMSNNDISGSLLSSGHAATPMVLDLLAIQQIYGANMSYHTGNDIYAYTQDFNRAVGTIWDAGGIDTIDATAFSSFAGGVTIDLRPGIGSVKDTQGAYGLMAIAYNVDIENAVGGGSSDIIFGNALANLIDGRGGADLMAGRGGNDTYYVDSPGDSVIENAGEGTDTVIASVSSYVLPANVENLSLSAFGGQGTGNAQNNILTAAASGQTLIGGAGDDTYVIGSPSASTFFAFSGDASDFITGGSSYYFDPSMGAFAYNVYDTNNDQLADTLIVTFSNFASGGSTFWELDFSTRYTDLPLQTGNFANAVRGTVFDPPGHPGLNIYGDGRASNTVTGSFTITAASFDMSGPTAQVLDFAVSYEQHSEGATPALRGVLNINHTGPSTNVVELPNEGIDSVQSAVSFSLPANVEILTLTGSANISGSGNGLDNFISGNSGNNTLSGGLGNDTLSGGAGNDILDGGAGTDVAAYTGLSAAYTVRQAGVTTIVSGADGTDALTGIEVIQFGDRTLAVPAARSGGDFGGDGKSDILWRNDNGQVVIWSMNGTAAVGAAIGGPVSSDWKIVDGSGDYNGDGKSDILWRNDNGQVVTWTMNGIAAAGAAIGGPVSSDWKIIDGSGDYNGDGKSDILWRNDNGQVVTWTMNGIAAAGAAIGGPVSSDWKIVDGSGDYNGDGKSDILWRNSNGQVVTWTMNGTAAAGAAIGGPVSSDWKIVDGSGDYNGDGRSDILWRNDNGQVVIWSMNGASAAGAAVGGPVSSDWKIVDGSGDYNGDGKSDILWRNDNGQVVTWTMDGASATGAAIGGPISADWHIQG